jgi:uncharacterized membrane protein YfcA
MDWSLFEIALVCFALLLGGLVKGTFGIGLPMVATSALAMFLKVPLAIVLMTFPMILSNCWQAYRDGGMHGLRRFWPMLIAVLPGIWLSTELLFIADQSVLLLIMGGSLMFFSALQLTPFRLQIAPESEVWMTPLVGFLGGVIGGLTTFFGAVIAMYLIVLKMERDEFIGAIGLIYSVCSLILLGVLGVKGAVNLGAGLLSIAICVPMFLGLAVGQTIRRHLEQEAFFKGVSVFLILIGGSLIGRVLF